MLVQYSAAVLAMMGVGWGVCGYSTVGGLAYSTNPSASSRSCDYPSRICATSNSTELGYSLGSNVSQERLTNNLQGKIPLNHSVNIWKYTPDHSSDITLVWLLLWRTNCVRRMFNQLCSHWLPDRIACTFKRHNTSFKLKMSHDAQDQVIAFPISIFGEYS